MQRNQTAEEIFKEYEQLAIAETNEYCRLKRHEPNGAFPNVARNIGTLTLLAEVWKGITRRLAEGPEMYESGGEQSGEWGFM